ncbi:MAG: hypothetical protein AAGH67_13705 [Cyanobacteria bacterium P01_H01_bin.162]
METRSRAANLVRRPRYGRWVHGLLIAEAVLLILVAGSVGLVVAWDMLKYTQPLPTSTATRSLQPERSLATTIAANPNCIVRSVETAPVQGRTCISES